jgi:diguanylate cyclase (GGDEF)-like protein/putative nucleotidyltransferase with HDIG domain
MPASSEGEPKEVNGAMTALTISYVERKGGRRALDELLEITGLTAREADLRDDNAWLPDQFRVDLLEGAAQVLDDPHVGERVGAAALSANVGVPLKISLRALGSPRLLLQNISRASAKLSRVHRMDALEVGSNHARVRNRPLLGTTYHPCDCDFNIGVLTCAPKLFGLPAARVSHPRCIGRGDPECLYDVYWSSSRRRNLVVAAVAGAIAALAASAMFAPALIPVAALLASIVAAVAGRRVVIERRQGVRLMQRQIDEGAEVTDLLMASMQDLVSELQLDDVLSKITANAQAAVGGAEFALLVHEHGRMHCRSSSDLPARIVEALEDWADSRTELLQSSVLVEDLGAVPELEGLPRDPVVAVGSLCAAPLVFRETRMGVLVALGANEGFLPRDVELLSSYAAQAAIAITNATLYETQQRLAVQDPLTGLFNHRQFHEVLSQELERCRRHGGELGLILFDLDSFKLVNDTKGHAAGDQVLRDVARALEATCRRSDVAFRVGGDEFALLLPGTGGRATGIAAARAQAAIAAIGEDANSSYGISSWPDAGPTKDAVIAAADADLYEMKRLTGGTSGASHHPHGGSRLARHERLACASRISVKLAPLHEEEEIARTAIGELDESFRLHLAAIHAIGDDGVLRTVAAAGPGSDHPRFSQRVPALGSPGRAVDAGEAILIDDVTTAVDGGENSVPGAASEIAVPIRVDGEPWGILELVHSETRELEFIDLLFADTIASTIGASVHRAKLYGELEGAFMRTLAVLSDALEAKDSYTAAHAREVADLSAEIGAKIGMQPDELRTLSYAALLHDIGKIGVRGEILHKPGPLTPTEYEEMKEHTVVGARMLERIPYFSEVHPLVRWSHERWDGNGYPDGLAGHEIPLGARVIAACDAFHAMTSDRPYRRAMTPHQALAELEDCSGTQFDPAVITALVEVLDLSPGQVIELPTANSG